jgi:uncharacterized cofD-like protein
MDRLLIIYQRIARIARTVVLWLSPGLGVKRWLATTLAGTTLLGVGAAYLLLDIYRQLPGTLLGDILANVTLIFLPRWLRALVFGVLGVGLVIYGVVRLNASILRPYIRPGQHVVDTLADFTRRRRGPRVVAVGGGHGLSTLLRGLKAHSANLTAIVTVADDGGSSGRLRTSMGILPPGDIRNCLAALSDDEELITQLFQYRFSDSADELGGHSFGNLFISAMSELTGSFESAVAESGRVLAVNGQVLPSTLHDVRLVADKALPMMQTEVRVEGESRIPQVSGTVRRVWLEPNNAPAFPLAIQAILNADLIVIGPGSLFTSILPNLLVSDLAAAIRHSPALKIYVCNVATQPGETDGYSCGDHIHALEEHAGESLFDLIVSNSHQQGELPALSHWVTTEARTSILYPVYSADVADHAAPGKHDPAKLSQVLIDLWRERTGPLTL